MNSIVASHEGEGWWRFWVEVRNWLLGDKSKLGIRPDNGEMEGR